MPDRITIDRQNNMRLIMRIMLSMLLTGMSAVMSAQEMRGKVTDGNGAAVAYANVVLMRSADSTMVSGAVTDEDGSFVIRGNAEGAFIRISSVGYETRFVTPDGPDLGVLTLTGGKMLDEVTVKAMRPVTRLVNDAMRTSVEGTVLEKAGTANDVLRQVPGIVEKERDKFEVIGKGAPVFYVNGREVRDLTDLDLLGSENIKAVEVVYTPGAKYDASTVAVVRIVTKKPQGEGLSLTDRLTARRDENNSGSNMLEMNYRKGGLDIFTSFFAGTERNDHKSIIENSVATPDTIWNTNNTQVAKARLTTIEGTVGFSYYLDEHSSLGLRYQISKILPHTTNVDFQSMVSGNGTAYDMVNSTIANDDDQRPTHYVNAYYDGRIGKGELFVDADFHYDKAVANSAVAETSQSFEERAFTTVGVNRNVLFAGKVDYTLPLWDGSMSIGAKYTDMNRDDDYFISQPYAPSSTSNIKERNAAAYVQYVHSLLSGQLTAGLRYECTTFDYQQDGKRDDEESRSYGNIFPSLGYTRQIGKAMMMLNYSIATKRPSYQELTSNVTYASRYIMETGNPLLKTCYLHDASAIVVWKYLQFLAQYNHMTDASMLWDEPYGASSSVTLISQRNKSYDMLTTGVTASPSFGIWQPTIAAFLLKTWLSINSGERAFRTDVPLYQFVMQNNLRLPHGYSANLTYRLTTKSDYQNFELTSATNVLDAYVNKSFMKNALDVTVGIQDIFQQKGRQDIVIHGNRMLMKQFMEYPTRNVYVTLKYNLNATKSKFKGRGASDSEIQRLAPRKD